MTSSVIFSNITYIIAHAVLQMSPPLGGDCPVSFRGASVGSLGLSSQILVDDLKGLLPLGTLGLYSLESSLRRFQLNRPSLGYSICTVSRSGNCIFIKDTIKITGMIAPFKDDIITILLPGAILVPVIRDVITHFSVGQENYFKNFPKHGIIFIVYAAHPVCIGQIGHSNCGCWWRVLTRKIFIGLAEYHGWRLCRGFLSWLNLVGRCDLDGGWGGSK
jgi:hypothetical protein